MSELLVIKDKVGRYIKEVFNVSLGDDGEFLIQYESVLVVAEVLEITDQESVSWRKEMGLPVFAVSIFSPVLFDVRPSNELFTWIAIDGQDFDYGTFKYAFNDESKKVGTLVFNYTIAADTVDAEEVKNAVVSVAFAADNNDEKLKKMFGGRRLEDNK
jgi:hypothetical protein